MSPTKELVAIDENDCDKVFQKPTMKKNICGSFRQNFSVLFPIFSWLSTYSPRQFLLDDILAGIHLGLYQIPQCLAMSLICGRPAIYSFFSFIVASILYTVFGSHRRLSYGIFSLVSAIYLGIILDRATASYKHLNHSKQPLNLDSVTALVTFIIGIYALAASVLRLGALIRFVPHEVLSGFRAGLFLLLGILQLNSMLNMDLISRVDLEHGMEQLILPRLIYKKFYPTKGSKETNYNPLFLSLGCMGILLIFRLLIHYWLPLFRNRWARVRHYVRLIPVEFILLLIGMLVAKHSSSFGTYKLKTIGNIGRDNTTIFDIKHLRLQTPDFEHYQLVWGECITACLMLALYAHSLAADFNVLDTELHHQSSQKRFEINPRRVDYVNYGWSSYGPSRELFSIGLMNTVASFLRCLPVGPSGTSSHRLRAVGGYSQLSGAVSAAVMVGAWYCLHDYFSRSPQSIVASIVAFDCCVRLFREIQQLNRFWAIAPIDLIIWIFTFGSFIFLNIEFSLYLSLALSLIVYIYRARLFWTKTMESVKLVTLLPNSHLCVPERILADPQLSGSFAFFPMEQIRDIQVFQFKEQHLTISNVDIFICDVFKRLAASMRNDSCNRFVFDCHSLRKVDWFTVRTIKALIDRIVEIEDSWRAIHAFLLEQSSLTDGQFGCDEKSDENNNHVSTKHEHQSTGMIERTVIEKTSSSNTLIVTFVFPPKIVRLIKSVQQPVNYIGFQRSLNISLRGAFCSILNSMTEQGIPEVRTVSSSKDHLFDDLSTDQIMEIVEEKPPNSGSSSNNSASGGGVVPEKTQSKLAKSRNRLTSYFRRSSSPLGGIQTPPLPASEEVELQELNLDFQVVKEIDKRDKKSHDTVMPLSFRQTDDEFSTTSSVSSIMHVPKTEQLTSTAPTSTALSSPPPPPPPPPPPSSQMNRSTMPRFSNLPNGAHDQPGCSKTAPRPQKQLEHTHPQQQPAESHPPTFVIESRSSVPINSSDNRRSSGDSDIRRKLESLFNSKTTFL